MLGFLDSEAFPVSAADLGLDLAVRGWGGGGAGTGLPPFCGSR